MAVVVGGGGGAGSGWGGSVGGGGGGVAGATKVPSIQNAGTPFPVFWGDRDLKAAMS